MTAAWLLAAALLAPGVEAECQGGLELHVTFDGIDAAVRGDRFVIVSAPPVPAPGVAVDSGAGPVASREVGRLIRVGEDTEGRSVELALNGHWVLRRGADEKRLAVPRSLSRSEQVQVLGSGPGGLWLAAPDVVAWLDVEHGALSFARVGRRGVVPQLVEAADAVVIAVGQELLRCAISMHCERVGELPAPVETVIAGPGGWLYAAGGKAPGLYRAPRGTPSTASRLAAGEVLAICHGREGTAWAVLRGDNGLSVLAAATDTPAVRPFPRSEVLARAMLDTPLASAEAVVQILDTAAREGWPERQALALHAMADPRPEVRKASARAFGGVPGARGIAGLWLLARDRDQDVRREALTASAGRCGGAWPVSCAHMFGAFVSEADVEVAWTARDLLVLRDPVAALANAPTAYKLDVIPMLVDRLTCDPDRAAQRALAVLSTDQDPAVRAAAALALDAAVP